VFTGRVILALDTVFPAARIVPQQPARTLLLMVLSISLAGINGCTSIRAALKGIWKPGPSNQWASKANDSGESTAKKQPPVEPAVAANVALGSDAVQEPTASQVSKNDKRSKSTVNRTDPRIGQAGSHGNEIAQHPESNNIAGVNSESVTEALRTDLSMERLTAALSDDGLSANLLPQRSLTALDDQIQIDALISQANQLLDNGQLEQARQKAQQAQDLFAKSQIDFAPDDDRPIDLVRRIQGRLEASRLQDESQLDQGISESPSTPVEPNSSEVATKSTTPAETVPKDSSSLARLRRDWSTLFRREKKQTSQEPVPANQNSEPAPPPPSTIPTQQSTPKQRVPTLVVQSTPIFKVCRIFARARRANCLKYQSRI